MAPPRVAVSAAAVVLVVAVAVCCLHLPCVNSGGFDGGVSVAPVGSCDGTTTLGQCWVGDELTRKPYAKYISYAALKADQIPCNKRGQSYYNNCVTMKQMNPYTRGCSAITRCARNMN